MPAASRRTTNRLAESPRRAKRRRAGQTAEICWVKLPPRARTLRPRVVPARVLRPPAIGRSTRRGSRVRRRDGRACRCPGKARRNLGRAPGRRPGKAQRLSPGRARHRNRGSVRDRNRGRVLGRRRRALRRPGTARHRDGSRLHRLGAAHHRPRHRGLDPCRRPVRVRCHRDSGRRGSSRPARRGRSTASRCRRARERYCSVPARGRCGCCYSASSATAFAATAGGRLGRRWSRGLPRHSSHDRVIAAWRPASRCPPVLGWRLR